MNNNQNELNGEFTNKNLNALDISIQDMDLSKRAFIWLFRCNLMTVKDILEYCAGNGQRINPIPNSILNEIDGLINSIDSRLSVVMSWNQIDAYMRGLEHENEVQNEEMKKNALDISIQDMNISIRAFNWLIGNNLMTVKDILKYCVGNESRKNPLPNLILNEINEFINSIDSRLSVGMTLNQFYTYMIEVGGLELENKVQNEGMKITALDISVQDMNISIRAQNCLCRYNLMTVKDILEYYAGNGSRKNPLPNLILNEINEFINSIDSRLSVGMTSDQLDAYILEVSNSEPEKTEQNEKIKSKKMTI